MLLDAAKKLIGEYRNEFKNFSDFAYNGEHAFTRAEHLFYNVVNDFVDYGPETLGDVSREELLDKIASVELTTASTNLKCLLTFALAWSLFDDKQKSKFTRLFTDGDTTEDETWKVVQSVYNRSNGETELFGFSTMLGQHLDSVAGVEDSESTLVLDEFDQEELIEHFAVMQFCLAETKTRFKYMFCTVLVLLTIRQKMSLRSAIL